MRGGPSFSVFAVAAGAPRLSPLSFQLEPEQWALLRAIDFGLLDLSRIEQDLSRLGELGLAETGEGRWRISDYGRMLLAARRQI